MRLFKQAFAISFRIYKRLFNRAFYRGYSEQYGDLFASTAPALAHGVNCQGNMGGGIAVLFRKRWPQLFADYKARCESDQLGPGEFYAWQDSDGRWIYNLATQKMPGPDARIEWVRQSMAAMTQHALRNNVSEIAMPRIGCGIGGLEWNEVERTIKHYSKYVPITVYSL